MTLPEQATSKHDLRRRRAAWLAVFIAPIVAVLVVVMLVQQVSSANQMRDAERGSQERRNLLMEVLSAQQDVETGQRGYLIAGTEEFLEPMRYGEAKLDSAILQLRREYTGNRDQLRRLQGIEVVSGEKRAFSERVVLLRRNGAEASAFAMVRSGRGKDLMDDVRRRIEQMMREEIQVLEDATRKSETATARFRWVMFGLLALLLALLYATTVALRRVWVQRREALSELQDTAARRAAILNSAMDGILTLNPSGTIEGASAAATRIFGYSEDELVSRDAGMLFASPTPIGALASLLQAMHLEEGRQGALHEIVGRRKDGSTFPSDVALTVAPLAEGLRYVAIIRDITDRQRAERIKAEFVATVSHELRTPLTSIAGSLGLLAAGAAGELGDQAARLVTIAHNNADRLVRLINDILDIEKLESGKMRFDNRLLDLGPALEKAVEENWSFARSHNVSLTLDTGTTSVWVFADPDRLAQVFTNLLSNAIKFSPENGTVDVIVSAGPKHHRITICDQGTGVPEEFRSHIFEKFAQAESSDSRSKGGTGLGLSIVQEIVGRLGGTVSFDNSEDKGSRFHVQLPAVDEKLGDERKGRTVLLYGEALAPAVRRELRDSQYSVVIAGNSAEACRQLATSRFDALLLWMGLDEEDPVKIIRYARGSALNESIPIIAVGGEVKNDLVSEPALIVDWLHKPVELDSLVARLDAGILSWTGLRHNILHVDDDPDILRVVRAALGQKANVLSAQSLVEARDALARQPFDLIILDLTLRDGNGAELLEALRSRGVVIPIIIFSAEDADRSNLRNLEAFLTKARTPLESLVSIVDREAGKYRVGK